jgi:acyl-CoA synthetase (AMP-forming)/AMP-acid ligase II
MLHARATESANAVAYTFLADGTGDASSLTWAELERRCRVLGTLLLEENATGQPVLLALSSGLSFVESLFACWYAGAIAVPVSLPRHRRLRHRLEAIAHDSGARIAIGAPGSRASVHADSGDDAFTPRLCWIDAAARSSEPGQTQLDPPVVTPDGVALLQYTSGSTGSPRGVIVTHSNLSYNSSLIAAACGHQAGEVIAGWLPLFHDMGLIGLIVQAVASGVHCVFMSPERFLMRPCLWLQMISDFRACSSPAPNFAYDLCVDKVTAEQKAHLDLSAWRNALNGSEPVRSASLERFATAFASCGFRRNAFFPCYGLAESTLFATGPGPERHMVRRSVSGVRLEENACDGYVGCGGPHGDTQIAVVDSPRCVRVTDGQIGEIWIKGASIASGYWNQPEFTLETFQGRLAAADPRSVLPECDEGSWLRTGDLGFVAEGQLFITGRIRELIIIAGRNHFPIDIERTVEAAVPSIIAVAAFSREIDGAEALVVAVELRRRWRSDFVGGEAVCHRIRAAIAADHSVVPRDVALLRPGAIPRTSSGKISRQSTRHAYLNSTLRMLESSDHAVGPRI